MKQLTFLITLFSLGILFTGCPYESNVPVDTPTVQVNPHVLGTWTERNAPHVQYKVGKQDNFTYEIVRYDKNKNEKTNYRAYESVVNKVTFLNLWEYKANATSHSYGLYKMEVKEGSLLISEVTDNITERFSTSRELRDFIALHMKQSYFFGKEKMELIPKKN